MKFPQKWYCSIGIGEKISATTTSLAVARGGLTLAHQGQPQGIIPMIGREPLHPNALAKKWYNGGMWWKDEEQVKKWQEMCRKVLPSGLLIHSVEMNNSQKSLRRFGGIGW